MKRCDASDRFAKFFARMGIKGAFLTVFALLFVSIAVSGALELHFERGAPRANILDAEDALWWAVSTVSTVGYGDTYPVTTGGRIVGMCLMFIGISLFGMCSALTASTAALIPIAIQGSAPMKALTATPVSSVAVYRKL